MPRSRARTRPSSSASTPTSFSPNPAAAGLLREWAELPAVDHHCHPLLRLSTRVARADLRRAFTEAVDPEKISVPTLMLRGEYDGIAGMDDLLAFYRRLPHPDKQFSVMEGISHASFQQKNYLTVYHLLHGFFTQPEPVYRG